MEKYTDILKEKGVHHLMKKPVIDRSALQSKHEEERLALGAEMEDKVLRILIHLCECPDICERELAIQNRKNVRLGRCIQESHVAFGVQDASILMADIFGFMGVFYQVQPMGKVAIAGKITSSFVHLPRTEGALEEFLEGDSLAVIWNFISYLEKQGLRLVRAKDRFKVTQEKARLSNALIGLV
ncbi:hypothetical protein BGX27_010537 [Mortierella sp. AM989]|nr:hypothetical protein BGX27_010537 [Mortierella sp. AM989]